MKGVIYCYHCIPTGKKYIGQTKNEKVRKYQHLLYCRRGVDNKFYRAVRKYGWNNFIYGIISDIDRNSLDEQEIFYIEKYDAFNNGYNSTLGGGGFKGLTISESHKQKIKISCKNKLGGKNNGFYGKKHSKKIREKWSKERKNVPYWNNGQINKRSLECPGEGWIRGGLKKGNWWNNGLTNKLCLECPGNDWKPGKLSDKTYIFISPLGDEVLTKNLSHFSKEFNLDYRTVLRLLKKQKKYQSHKGWKFKFIVEI